MYEGERKRLAEKYNCDICEKEFLRRKKVYKNQKKSRYCSKECACKGRENKIEVICFNCKKKTYKRPSTIKVSKHKVYFCSRKCKDYAQSLSGNCDIIRPFHYGTANGMHGYRKIAKSNFPWECKCGVKYDGVLSVHHIDGDRSNNEADNLEVLCPLCHSIRHMDKNKKGEWRIHNAALTPRGKIADIEKKIFGKVIVDIK